MFFTFLTLVAVMGVITFLAPLPAPVQFEVRTDIVLETSPLAKYLCVTVVLLTLALYIIFW